MLMTQVPSPSLRDCQVISKALHTKFQILGHEVSEVWIVSQIVIIIFITIDA